MTCRCCPERPRGLLLVRPRQGFEVRRNKGRGNSHAVSLTPREVVVAIAGTTDPEAVVAYVRGLFGDGGG